MTQTAQNTPIRQAMILAAGKGTRMRPLTLNTPKPLIAVGGQPLIVWHILALKAAGITRITINCSWLADKLIQALGDGSQFGVSIYWSVEETPLETAGGIAYALASNKLNPEPFLLVNGDVWTTYDFNKLVNQPQSFGNNNNDDHNHLAHLLLIDNPDHNPTGDFAMVDGLAVTKTMTKSMIDTSTKHASTQHTEVATSLSAEPLGSDSVEFYTFSGLSIIHPKLVNAVAYQAIAPLAPLLNTAMLQKQITAEKIQDTWVDVGTPERLAKVNQFIDKQLLAGGHLGQIR